jgi:hypothetical protein
MKIKEHKSKLPNIMPVKEKMSVFIPDIDKNIPNRNGAIIAMLGSGGSGKTSLLLSLFKSKNYYRNKFDNLYVFTPLASFLSVKNHPFEKHTKVYHELKIDTLDDIYDEILELKEQALESQEPIEHSCIIIDDFANSLKNNELLETLNKMIIKSRHLACTFIFTLQSYNLFPLTLRKQITNAIIFKPKNKKETELMCSELINLNKDECQKLFNYVFDKPYTHLDIDTFENKLYKNFNLLEIEE